MRTWVKVLASIPVADSPIAFVLRLSPSQEVLLVSELWLDCPESARWRGYLLHETGPKSGFIGVKVLRNASPAVWVGVCVSICLICPCETSLSANDVQPAPVRLHRNTPLLSPGSGGKEVRVSPALNEITMG